MSHSSPGRQQPNHGDHVVSAPVVGAPRGRRERRDVRLTACRSQGQRSKLGARLYLCLLLCSTSVVRGGVMQEAMRGNLHNRASYMPKTELLGWLNQLLKSDFSKVEQCANGAPYCQVLDALFPEEFPLKRVHFGAKAEHDSIRNYKIIQQFFLSKGISKSIDVNRLLKGRPMDNLEFLQWLKGFYDENDRGVDYDAVERRKQCAGGQALAAGRPSRLSNGSRFTSSPRVGGTRGPSQQPPITPKTPTPQSRFSNSPHPSMTPRPGPQTGASAPVERGTSVSVGRSHPRPSSGPASEYTDGQIAPPLASPVVSRVVNSPGAMQNAGHLTREIEALHHTVSELEKERNFYYDRLRAVELLCQSTEESPEAPAGVVALCKQILEMMYEEGDEAAPGPVVATDEPQGQAQAGAGPVEAAADAIAAPGPGTTGSLSTELAE